MSELNMKIDSSIRRIYKVTYFIDNPDIPRHLQSTGYMIIGASTEKQAIEKFKINSLRNPTAFKYVFSSCVIFEDYIND